jgi:hypothetical protein
MNIRIRDYQDQYWLKAIWNMELVINKMNRDKRLSNSILVKGHKEQR